MSDVDNIIRIHVKSQKEWDVINLLFNLTWASHATYSKACMLDKSVIIIVRPNSFAKYGVFSDYSDVLSFEEAVALKVEIPKVKIL